MSYELKNMRLFFFSLRPIAYGLQLNNPRRPEEGHQMTGGAVRRTGSQPSLGLS